MDKHIGQAAPPKATRKRMPHSLWLYFTCIIFGVSLAAAALMLLLWILFYQLGLSKVHPLEYHFRVLSLLEGSVFVGGVIAVVVGRVFIRPIQKIGNAFDELSRGNFDVRVPTNERIAAVQKIAERFNAMTYDLAHVETLRNDFVVNVSHEFKTPLAAIEGYVTLLQSPSLSPERRDAYIEKILSNTSRLSTLSSNILALSKLENQETVLHMKEYQLDEQLRRAVLLLEDKWAAKGICFEIDLERQSYYGNEKLLDQVWFNLLDNAVKHSNPGGRIEVTLATDVHAVFVAIADHGDGMSEEVQRHIFEKFYQGDSSHKSEGNGLGLTLVKRIVELCHGEITVQSKAGMGSSFTVKLPLA